MIVIYIILKHRGNGSLRADPPTRSFKFTESRCRNGSWVGAGAALRQENHISQAAVTIRLLRSSAPDSEHFNLHIPDSNVVSSSFLD